MLPVVLLFVLAFVGMFAVLSIAMMAKGKGGKKSDSKPRRSSSGKGYKKPVKKLFTIPLATFVQLILITEKATGNRADDILLPFIQVITGGMSTDVFQIRVREWMIQIVTYIVQNPQKVFVDTAIVTLWTTGLRRLAAMAGAPKYIRFEKFKFQVEVR